MKNSVKTSLIVATAAMALPLTFRADSAKGSCAADGAACSAKSVKAVACEAGAKACSAEKVAVCEASGKTCSASKTVATQTETKLKPGYFLATYQVEGMSCAACESKLTKVLAKIEGVEKPTACAKSKVAKVAYNPKKVKDAQLLTAIRKAGFTVKGETLQVGVKGMSCGACSSKVSKAIAALKGVKEQKVCHVSKQAIVTFDPKQISGDKVVAAISGTGFTVVR